MAHLGCDTSALSCALPKAQSVGAAPGRRQAQVEEPTGNSTEPRQAVGRSGETCVCLGTHRKNLGQNFVVPKGEPAVSSRHRPWHETREAEGVF